MVSPDGSNVYTAGGSNQIDGSQQVGVIATFVRNGDGSLSQPQWSANDCIEESGSNEALLHTPEPGWRA